MVAAGEFSSGTRQSMGAPAMQSFERRGTSGEMQNRLLEREAFGVTMASAPPASNDPTLPMRTAAAARHGGELPFDSFLYIIRLLAFSSVFGLLDHSAAVGSCTVMAALPSRTMPAPAAAGDRNDRAITHQYGPTGWLIGTIVHGVNEEIGELEAALDQEVRCRMATEQRERELEEALLAAAEREQQILEAAQQLSQACLAAEQREREQAEALLAAAEREQQILEVAQQLSEVYLAAEWRERAVAHQLVQTTMATQQKVQALEQELAALRQLLQAVHRWRGMHRQNIDNSSSPAPARRYIGGTGDIADATRQHQPLAKLSSRLFMVSGRDNHGHRDNLAVLLVSETIRRSHMAVVLQIVSWAHRWSGLDEVTLRIGVLGRVKVDVAIIGGCDLDLLGNSMRCLPLRRRRMVLRVGSSEVVGRLSLFHCAGRYKSLLDAERREKEGEDEAEKGGEVDRRSHDLSAGFEPHHASEKETSLVYPSFYQSLVWAEILRSCGPFGAASGRSSFWEKLQLEEAPQTGPLPL
uniref:Uncharacterized protein n=1 Tax=Oryza brachyantha TaxID=4533 RepID=J3M0T5_ORYBR